jgi:hypothetical protein
MANPDTTETNTNPLASFFWGNNPNINQQLRQRIALQMMQSNKKAFPKNIGEGLSAIGDAIGDRGLARMLEQSDQAAQTITPPPAAQPASYTPTGDVQDAPAVKAINAAITPTPSADVQPSPAVMPVADGGYNFIDAQAGGRFKPMPGYLQDAITSREPDPDMQAYFGSLSNSEAKNAQDVSPTGAAGPYQFTRGTGAQYGIPGAARMYPGASTDAVRALTADNAATFQRVNGRPPTFQELALMHQQGGQTGANMVAGVGNAPPGNLAVNNIPSGATAPQAIARVNNFYGMPNAPAPVSTRDAIAAQLARQTAPGVPQPNPTLGAGQNPPSATSPTLALAAGGAGSPAEAAQNRQISFAIKPPSATQPGVQVAQAQPQAVPGYVPPQPDDPAGASIVGMKPREIQLRNWLAANQGNPYAAMKVAPELEALTNERTTRQNEANELYKAKILQATEQAKQRQAALVDQAKRTLEAEKLRQEIEQANVPKVQKLEGNEYERNKETGVYEPVRTSDASADAPPKVNLTEPQAKALTFHGWANMGNEGIKGNDQLLAHGLQQELLGKIPFAGNALQSAQYRAARNAANNFVLAFMRDTSGAAYGAKEMLDHAGALLPKYGDDAKTLADKAAQRQNFVDTLYGGLGPGRAIADFYDKKRKTEEQTKQSVIDSEMQGVTPKAIGDTRTNIKTGAKRVWNGKNWVEM